MQIRIFKSARQEMYVYVIAHQGGGFKGAFGVPIIRHLVKERKPDLILGVSVGAINGVMAAQCDFNDLEEFWSDVDDKQPVDGITGFLRPAMHRGRALFHLGPMRKKLEKYVSLSKLKISFGCGAVSRETDAYHTFMSTRMRKDKRLWDAVEASSAIAGLMEPVSVKFRGRKMTWSDGGHLHSIPLLPQSIKDNVTDVDLILTNPISSSASKTEDVDGMLESFEWALHISSLGVQTQGLARYRILRRTHGVTVRVFAPTESLGSLLRADREMIDWRIAQGERSLHSPVVWLP